MKKKIQSTVYILFVLVTFFGLVKAFTAYQNPFDFFENPLVSSSCLVSPIFAGNCDSSGIKNSDDDSM